jgi:hypothetical protein
MTHIVLLENLRNRLVDDFYANMDTFPKPVLLGRCILRINRGAQKLTYFLWSAGGPRLPSSTAELTS